MHAISPKVSCTKRTEDEDMPRTARTRTLPPLNNGQPLCVRRMADGQLCIPDANTNKVWVEQELVPRLERGVQGMPRIECPRIPDAYGEWKTKSIGGVSLTERRVNIVRASGPARALTLFAINGRHADSVKNLVEERAGAAIAEVKTQKFIEEFGHTTEILVHNSDDVHFVASLVARTEATPMLEDSDADAQRPLGIERLDRIECEKIAAHDKRVVEEGDAYGCRRGGENWNYPWLPDRWVLPLTWDRMVENIPEDIPLRDLPSPLSQHVARHRLEQAQHERIGTKWTAHAPLTREEVRTCPLWDLLEDADPAFLEALAAGRASFSDEEVAEWQLGSVNPDRTLVVLQGGACFRPVDTRRTLTRWIPPLREVSAALTPAQSHQLIEAFYLLTVERLCQPDDVVRALELVMFRYMFERGYTARWMGKYTQNAAHVGNGKDFRKFLHMNQYRPDLLPARVINNLCGRDGKLKGKGSKGSRSKYPVPGKKRYRPNHRFQRSEEDEQKMRGISKKRRSSSTS